MHSEHIRKHDSSVVPGNDAANLSVLLAVLAKVFRYPSMSEAVCLVEEESVAYCLELLLLVGLERDVCPVPPEPVRAIEGKRPSLGRPCDDTSLLLAAQELRLEMSRLFYAPLCPIRLEGRYWVPREKRSGQSALMGERAGVALEYASNGIRLKKCSGTAEDSLENELDFVSKLACGEAIALSQADAARALHWKETRRQFYEMHMRDFIAGVTACILKESNNPFLRYYAHALSVSSGRMAE